MILSPRRTWLAALVLLSLALPASAQTVVKYGADYLAAGVGARALGMGGAYIAHADDVTAGYWNVSGLDAVRTPEVAYMHAERFDGAVAFDYAAGAYPLSDRSTLGVTFIRSAVDDIANTLDAYDPATGQINPDDVTLFSAADNALFVSYARGVGDKLSLGASAKVIRRGVGDFASAWAYSLDLGAQLDLGRVRLGLMVQDATGMVQSWSVDADRFAEVDSSSRPVGLTELVLPLARLGASTQIPLSDDIGLTAAADLDLGFDGQSAYVLDAGGVSFRPRVGAELTFRDLLAFRAGLSDVTTSERFGTQITPSVGAGVQLGALAIDYGFGDFGGVTSELGFSHRVSLAYRFGASPR
ncbi:MAG: hypothetical protein CMM84_14155 [Rhodothermaceae bacterium]|mgnify:FL=1|nr:hypothetical protein [Rhodothermaceae bacterium]MBC13285.1 hypothetical protein [Rhodothermaceae bacterium]